MVSLHEPKSWIALRELELEDKRQHYLHLMSRRFERHASTGLGQPVVSLYLNRCDYLCKKVAFGTLGKRVQLYSPWFRPKNSEICLSNKPKVAFSPETKLELYALFGVQGKFFTLRDTGFSCFLQILFRMLIFKECIFTNIFAETLVKEFV